MLFSELKKELDAGKTRSLYIFTGEERGVMDKYLKRLEITATYPLLVLAIPVLTATGLFNIKQRICVTGGFDDLDYSELRNLCKNHVVVLLADTVDGRKKFYKDAAKDIVEFKRFTSDQLAGYVSSKLVDHAVESDAIYFLIAELCHNEVLIIDSECDKLVHLEPTVITDGLVREMISVKVEDRIFELADAIIKKESLTAYWLINDLRTLKVGELKIIVILYNRFQQLLLIQAHKNENDFRIGELTGINPWVVKMCRQLVGQRHNEYYSQGLKVIYEAETCLKGGYAPQDLIFNHLVFQLLVGDL